MIGKTNALVTNNSGAAGSILITNNGWHNVSDYAWADVEVSSEPPMLVTDPQLLIHNAILFRLPSYVSEIGTEIIPIETHDLTIPDTINLPDGSTYPVDKIAPYAFYHNDIIGNIIWDGEDFSGLSIEANAFRHCYNLTSVELPRGCAQVKMNAFGSCKSLQSVYLPASLFLVDERAFSSTALTYFELEEGFQTSAVLTGTYDRETLVAAINNLADVSIEGRSLGLQTNSAAVLNDEDIAIATAKGWTIT